MKVELLYFNHNCNCYLISQGNDCFLIDPGFNHNNCLIKAINDRKLTLRAILLTHAHYDHIEALKTIKNVPVYLYENEEKSLNNERFNCSVMSANPFIVEGLNVKTFLEGELDIIGIKLQVIHTPFHTSGSVCYYLKELGVVFTGDTLFLHAIGRYDLPTSTPRLIRQSLTKLFKLPHEENNDTIVYPGHGSKTTLSREYRFFKKEYLD
ncbi:MAG: MBL fold metallo-hydrolase [Bacilli bacterium]|nr:MBL fold metallo-hydrolase [Bacilli bacterium]